MKSFFTWLWNKITGVSKDSRLAAIEAFVTANPEIAKSVLASAGVPVSQATTAVELIGLVKTMMDKTDWDGKLITLAQYMTTKK